MYNIHSARYVPLPTAEERPPSDGHGQLSTPHANIIINDASSSISGPGDRVTGFMVGRPCTYGLTTTFGAVLLRGVAGHLVRADGFSRSTASRNIEKSARVYYRISPSCCELIATFFLPFYSIRRRARRWPDRTELKRSRRRRRVPVWEYRFRAITAAATIRRYSWFPIL